MNTLKANTPEELYQAIGEFLQTDYSLEALVKMYEDARKCANRFPVTYSTLPKVPTNNNDPLDGLQEILKWCDKSVKCVDDIASNLDQQVINESISQLKKLRDVADSVLSLVDTKLKEQALEEARTKVEKEYANLNEEASKTEGMSLIQLVEVASKSEWEAHAILRRETTDVVQIYLSKDPTFKDRVSQLGNEIHEALERLDKLIGSNTSTGKLFDIYCELKNIPLQNQFNDVGYAYSPINDWTDVICGGCNRLYTSIDNVIKTFEGIQTKAKLKTDETHSQKTQESHKIPTENGERRSGNTYNYINGDYVGQDKIGRDKAGRDIKSTPEQGGWVLIKKISLIVTIIVALIAIWEAYNKYIIKDTPAMEQVSPANNIDTAKKIVQEYFQLNENSISEFNAVWCDLTSNGTNSEFYATYYYDQFTKYLTVFTIRGDTPENLFHRNSKRGYDIQGYHVLTNDVAYFLYTTRCGSGGFLDLYIFQYDGINKLERIYTGESLFQGDLWVINNRIFLAGGNRRYELAYVSDNFKLIDYNKRVQYLEDSANHVLAYHIDGNDFKITYDEKPIKFTMIEDHYINNEPITLAIDEQIIEDDNIIGVEPQEIRLLSREGEFEYKPGFFCSLIPTGVGLKELSVSFNYGAWYRIKVLVVND